MKTLLVFLLVALTYVQARSTRASSGPPANCTDDPVDITLVLDSSGSIGRSNWQKVLDFAANIVRRFKIGPDNAQFAVVKYCTFVNVEFQLGRYNTENVLINQINSISYTGGNTNMAGAIEAVRHYVYRNAYGDRLNAKNVMIMVSDGKPNIREYETISQAKRAKDEGILIISVTAGKNIDFDLMREISTNDEVISASSLDDLNDVVDDITDTTCYYADGPDGCVGHVADIAFVLDTSGSVGLDNWARVLNFAASIVKEFTVGPKDVQFGLVKYSSTASVEYLLNEYQTEGDLISAITGTAYDGGLTNIAHSLELARTEIFTISNGDRKDANNIIVFVSDGKPNVRVNETLREAELVKNDGIFIISVGVTAGIDIGLMEDISSNNQCFRVSTFTNLGSIVNEIAKLSCQVAIDPPCKTAKPGCSRTCGIGTREKVVNCTEIVKGEMCCEGPCGNGPPYTGGGTGLNCKDFSPYKETFNGNMHNIIV